jgi:hypothetical protein
MADFHYLARQDYRRIIEQHELTTVVDGDELLLKDAEKTALEEMKLYMSGKYDVSDYFRPIYTWNTEDQFVKGTRVEVTADEYDEESDYAKDDLVSSLVFVYRANRDVLAGQGPKECPLFWDEVGQPNKIYIATADDIPAGNEVTDEANWSEDDSRNAFFVTMLTDLTVYHLMSRVGSIPEIRVKRYDDAKNILKNIAAGKLDIGLPEPAEENTPRPTNRMAMRSRTKFQNDW